MVKKQARFESKCKHHTKNSICWKRASHYVFLRAMSMWMEKFWFRQTTKLTVIINHHKSFSVKLSEKAFFN